MIFKVIYFQIFQVEVHHFGTNGVTDKIQILFHQHSNGIYWLIVFDANQCVSDTVYFDVTFLTSIETLTDLNKIIKLYPNPATNLATVAIEGIIGENITLEFI